MEGLIEALPHVMLIAAGIILLAPLALVLSLLNLAAGGGTSLAHPPSAVVRARFADLDARIRRHRHAVTHPPAVEPAPMLAEVVAMRPPKPLEEVQPAA